PTKTIAAPRPRLVIPRKFARMPCGQTTRDLLFFLSFCRLTRSAETRHLLCPSAISFRLPHNSLLAVQFFVARVARRPAQSACIQNKLPRDPRLFLRSRKAQILRQPKPSPPPAPGLSSRGSLPACHAGKRRGICFSFCHSAGSPVRLRRGICFAPLQFLSACRIIPCWPCSFL